MAQGDQYFLQPAVGERVELTGDTSVGRSSDCDLVVSDGQPSRQHAKITVEGGAVFVEDLNSTNGTFVNGTRIAEKLQLSDGDEVAFDVNKFTVAVVSEAPAMDQTMLRTPEPPEDPNRTVLRPMPPKEAVSEPEPAAPAPEPEPAEPAPAPPAAEAKPKAVKPGSWADPNEKNASSTQFFSPEDLAAMRGATVQEKVESDVPLLQVTSGGAAGSVIQLNPEGGKKEWTIGSADSRDIVFTDQGVSEFHTILAHESGRWKVVDQMSTNGTFVNGNKTVTGYLNSGDKIRIGTVECSFELPGGASSGGAGAASGGSSKMIVSVVAFVVVLAALFGAYYFLM